MRSMWKCPGEGFFCAGTEKLFFLRGGGIDVGAGEYPLMGEKFEVDFEAKKLIFSAIEPCSACSGSNFRNSGNRIPLKRL